MLEWPIFRPVARLIDSYSQHSSRERSRRFGSFLSTLPLTPEHYTSLRQLRDNPPQADLYITGGDQIWDPRYSNGRDPAFYLNFGPDTVKRASYATSFATKYLPIDSLCNMRARLSHLGNISVTESSGLDILSSLGYDGLRVVDPVFLLPRSRWESLAEQSEIKHNGEYILLYASYPQPLITQTARRLSKEMHMPIIAISHFHVKGVNKNYRNAGPLEFLRLVRDASAVLTDSFYALDFATIFHMPFYAFRRQGSHNIRIPEFLTTLGMPRRLITSEASTIPPAYMDFTMPDAILSDMRETSVDYLNHITSSPSRHLKKAEA